MARRPAKMIEMLGKENPQAVVWCEEAVDYLNKQFYICVAWLVSLILLFACLNFVPFLKPPEETAGSWLERSGALIGVFAMVVEFRIKNLDNVISSASMGLAPELFKQVNVYQKHINGLHKAVLVYAAIGAIIWSYGEPLYNGVVKIVAN